MSQHKRQKKYSRILLQVRKAKKKIKSNKHDRNKEKSCDHVNNPFKFHKVT